MKEFKEICSEKEELEPGLGSEMESAGQKVDVWGDDDDEVDWDNYSLSEILKAALEKAYEEIDDDLLKRQIVDSLETLIQSVERHS